MVHFNIVIIGCGGVGTSTVLNRLVTGNFTKLYIPTIRCSEVPITFQTSKGSVIITAMDCGGQEKFEVRRDDILAIADAVIIMFDVTSAFTFKKMHEYVDEVKRVCSESIPVVICGNKCDLPLKVSAESLASFGAKYKMKVYHISAKSMYNVTNVFLYIIRHLMSDENVQFV
jgi:small GTP-binding protein